MGEQMSKLKFHGAGLTSREAAEGSTAYEAKSEGVTYRVIGTMNGRLHGPRRTFRAFRVIGVNGNRLRPAAAGGEHKTRAAAFAQAEEDLGHVLAERTPATGPQAAYNEAYLKVGNMTDAIGLLHEQALAENARRREPVLAPLRVGDVVTQAALSTGAEWVVALVDSPNPRGPIRITRPGNELGRYRFRYELVLVRRPEVVTPKPRQTWAAHDMIKDMIREFREASAESPEAVVRMIAARHGIEIDEL